MGVSVTLTIGDRGWRARRAARWLSVYLLLRILGGARTLDAIAALDHVGLEAYRAWSAVEFEEEAAGVAEDGADLVPPP
jgi:hypothetical protein